jgi:signal transduction histidine kinase
LNNRKGFINKIFFWLTLSAALWILSIIIRFNIGDPYIILISTRWSYATATIIAFFISYFAYYFPRKNKYESYLSLIIPITIIVGYLSAFTPFIVENVKLINGTQKNVFGSLFYFFAVYFPIIVSWGIYNLLSKRNSLNRLGRSQVDFILIGLALSTAFGFSTNLIIPVLTQATATEPYGPLSVIFFILFTSYAILKHHLFNVKVIATELLVFGVWVFVLIRTLLAETLAEGIINGALFIVLVVLGFFLVRSVLQEVKSREKIQELAEELELANKQLKRLDRVKSEFISIASHQLRTPLSIIKGYSSMALEGDFGSFKRKEQKEVFEKISLSANRLINLIEDLLNISRLEQGRLSYEYSQVDMIKLVKGVVKELEPKAKAKHIKMFFKMPDEPVPKMLVDKDKLRQVFVNLIDNSIKYTEKGKIEVNVEKIDSKIKIEVADTGAGLTQEELSVLFQRFMRGKRVTQLYTEGVGLGLYFAKNIVEGHGGRIWAESPGPGKGSKFYVELPIKKQKAEARK